MSTNDGESLRLVCFFLREQEIGVPIAAVRETIRMRPITHVFLTPPWLVGIFSLRGEIVPAIDLAPWLGMGPTTVTADSRLVVLAWEGKVLGVLADALSELRIVAPDAINAPPPTLSAEQLSVLRGVSSTQGGVVRILDPAGLLGSDRLRALAQAPPT